jgi:hypothetical protein
MPASDDHQANIRTRLLGPCATFPSAVPDDIVVDVGALVRRLLLFDRYVLQSYRLREIPRLVSAFGSTGLITLLRSGVLRIQCEGMSIAHIGQTTVGEKRQRQGPLPLGSFCLIVIWSAEPDKYIHDALQAVHRIGGLGLKQAIKLKGALVDALSNSPPKNGLPALEATRADLSDTGLLRLAICRAAKEVMGLELESAEVKAKTIPIDDEDFRIESNLLSHRSINEASAHLILQKAVSAIANMNYCIESMKNYNALSGVMERDVDLLVQRMAFVFRDILPGVQESRFDRVIELAGFPDISVEAADRLIDAEKLLEIRQAGECSEFRDWLQRLDGAADSEITERIRGLKARVDQLVQSRGGKAIRVLVASALGTLFSGGDGGFVASAILGALDTFLVDNIFKRSGPAAFVNNHYRSLFRPEL